jgi:hypothetical protein
MIVSLLSFLSLSRAHRGGRLRAGILISAIGGNGGIGAAGIAEQEGHGARQRGKDHDGVEVRKASRFRPVRVITGTRWLIISRMLINNGTCPRPSRS